MYNELTVTPIGIRETTIGTTMPGLRFSDKDSTGVSYGRRAIDAAAARTSLTGCGGEGLVTQLVMPPARTCSKCVFVESPAVCY